MADIKDLFEPVFEIAAEVIEKSSEDNAMRHEYWKIMSANRWTNRDMDTLVDGILDYIELESVRFHRDDKLERVIPPLVDEYILMDISDWAVSDRVIARQLDPSVLRACERSADELARVKRDIEDAQRASSRREPVSRGRGFADRDDRGSRDRGGYSSRGEPGGRANAFAVRRGAPETSGRVRSGFSAAVESKGRSGREGGRGDRDDRVDLLNDRRDEAPVERTARPSRETSVARGVREAREPVAARAPRQRIDGPDFTAARPFDEFWTDGECWQPAHLSKWKLEPRQGELAAITTAYNPRKKIRFYVQDTNGNIREELKDMSQEMEYMRHELGARNRVRITDEQDPKYTPTEKPGYVAPSSLPDERRPIINANGAKIKVLKDRVIAVSSVEEAEMIAQFEHNLAGNITSIFGYAITVPVLVNNTENLELLRDIAESNNLTDAAQRLNACVDTVDAGLWEFINQRLTKTVNDVLRNHYGLGVTMTDFAKDYDALINWMKTKKDEVLARAFSLHTRFIPRSVMAELSEADRREWLMGTLNLTEEEFEQRQPNVLVFENCLTVAVCNFTLGDLGLLLTDKSQRIDPIEFPVLQEFLDKVLLNSDKNGEGATMYLLTRDHYRVEVIKSPVEKDTVLVRLLTV